MSSNGSTLRNGAAGGAVLGTAAAVVIWQALAQFVWTIYPYTCTDAVDYSACKAGPGREYTDFLAYFDDRLYNMIMHYMVAFVIALMISVLVLVAVGCYRWSYDFIVSHRFRRQMTKDIQKDLDGGARA